MGRIIKDTVLSVSFPPVQQLADTDEDDLLDTWEERDINWDAHRFGAGGIVWSEAGIHGYVYHSQDTRRKFAFDPEWLRRV